MAPPTPSVRDTTTPRRVGKTTRRHHKTPQQNIRQSIKAAIAKTTRESSLFTEEDAVPSFRSQSLDTMADFVLILMKDIVCGAEEIGNKHTFTYPKLTGSLQRLPPSLRASCAHAAANAKQNVRKIREQRKLQSVST